MQRGRRFKGQNLRVNRPGGLGVSLSPRKESSNEGEACYRYTTVFDHETIEKTGCFSHAAFPAYSARACQKKYSRVQEISMIAASLSVL
jgi:hypothetical protein